MKKSEHAELRRLLKMRAAELKADLKENDYSHIESVRYSKEHQIDSCHQLIGQLEDE